MATTTPRASLGFQYLKAKDYEKALSEFRKSADMGSVSATVQLGNMYHNGWGCAVDYALAMEMYKKAALSGDSSAQTNLGNMYKFGCGCPVDLKLAIEWYKKAASHGNAYAQANLADMYCNGVGCTVDYAKALELYKQSVVHGNAHGETGLGNMYRFGMGCSVNYEEALRLFTKAAEKGNSTAQNNLGDMYFYGTGVTPNLKLALDMYYKSAIQGNANAQTNLGNMYYYGEGCTKNYATAMIWYQHAAEKRNMYAQCNLGNMFRYGEGVAVNAQKAIRWYQIAAEQGNTTAQANLGDMYRYGEGCTLNCGKAISWYIKASELGNAHAQSSLGDMYRTGEGCAIDYRKAFSMYKLSADQGSAYAQANLADMYMYGEGCSINTDRALYWYTKASHQGNLYATQRLESLREEQGKPILLSQSMQIKSPSKMTNYKLYKSQEVKPLREHTLQTSSLLHLPQQKPQPQPHNEPQPQLNNQPQSQPLNTSLSQIQPEPQTLPQLENQQHIPQLLQNEDQPQTTPLQEAPQPPPLQPPSSPQIQSSSPPSRPQPISQKPLPALPQARKVPPKPPPRRPPPKPLPKQNLDSLPTAESKSACSDEPPRNPRSLQKSHSQKFDGEWLTRIPNEHFTENLSSECSLCNVTATDHQEEYQHVENLLKNLPDHSLKSVQLVRSKNLQRLFHGAIDICEERAKVPSFKIDIETLSAERRRILAEISSLPSIARHHGTVKIVRAWHGTTLSRAHSIMVSGFASLAVLDEGWFGKGIYFTTHPEYALRYSSEQDPCLIMCYLILFNPYPVLWEDAKSCNELVLEGKANYRNFGCHYVPVCKYNNSDYRPPQPGTNAQFDEIVIFQESNILPFAIVTMQRNTPIVEVRTSGKQEIRSWTVQQVVDWLSKLALSKEYVDTITNNHITGEVLLSMTKKEDWNEIGISTFGDVRILISKVNSLLLASGASM